VIVVDASVLANALGDEAEDGHTARDELRAARDLAAPDLIDVETVAVPRKRWLAQAISTERFDAAVTDLQRLDFERVPTRRLIRRASELRANTTAHDATYVALAEALGCDLLTADLRLANATDLAASFESCGPGRRVHPEGMHPDGAPARCTRRNRPTGRRSVAPGNTSGPRSIDSPRPLVVNFIQLAFARLDSERPEAVRLEAGRCTCRSPGATPLQCCHCSGSASQRLRW
jgi:predicted nucleic acid-binding protein